MTRFNSRAKSNRSAKSLVSVRESRSWLRRLRPSRLRQDRRDYRGMYAACHRSASALSRLSLCDSST